MNARINEGAVSRPEDVGFDSARLKHVGERRICVESIENYLIVAARSEQIKAEEQFNAIDIERADREIGGGKFKNGAMEAVTLFEAVGIYSTGADMIAANGEPAMGSFGLG